MGNRLRHLRSCDVDRLRLLGLADETVVDLVELIADINYTNRLAVGLGVDPEP